MDRTIPIKRILLIRPSALGDVCRSVPVLASLRATWPSAEIHWLVQDSFRAAVEFHPAIDGVVPFPRSSFRGGLVRPDRWFSMSRWLVSVGRARWDMAIDCQGLARTGLMLLGSRASIRVGDRSGREGAWLACNRRARCEQGIHEVDRMLAVAQAAGAAITPDARLYVGPSDDHWWQRHASGMSSRRYAVLASTSRWVSKAWPRTAWVDLSKRLAAWDIEAVVLPGSSAEQSDVGHTADAMRSAGVVVEDLSGRTSVGQLMAVIKSAAITVSNDSAPLHMAVGLGGRCLGLYGPTDPAIVGPWRLPEQAIRAPIVEGEPHGYRDSRIGSTIMSRLTVDQVAARVGELLGQWS